MDETFLFLSPVWRLLFPFDICVGSPAQHWAGEHQAERRASDAEGGGAEQGGDHCSVPGGAGEAQSLRRPAGQSGEGAVGLQSR